MPDCCIYSRISSDRDKDTADEGQGVERQEEDCRALADRLGWNITAVYTDNDLSAYTGKIRPGFEAMLDGIKRGEFDGLITWNTDRLIRRMDDLERLIEACDAADVTIKSVTSGELDVSTANGKMLARILGSVARQESEHKSERIRRAHDQLAANGRWVCSQRPFGYTDNGDILETEAALIRAAANDLLAQRSLISIVKEWNSNGVRTPKGKQWQLFPFKRMITSPRLAGIRTHRGKAVGRGNWQPILDEDTHNGVVAVLSDPTRQRPGSRNEVSWERKFVGSYRYLCGVCGAVLARDSNGGKSTYRCTESAHLSRVQQPLDDYVAEVVIAYLKDQDNLHRILGSAKRAADTDPADLRARRTALKASKDQLATLLADGVLEVQSVRREAGKLQQKIDTIDRALAEMARRSPLSELLSDGVDTLEERWDAATPDIKGKILDEFVRVRVMPVRGGGIFRPEFIKFEWLI